MANVFSLVNLCGTDVWVIGGRILTQEEVWQPHADDDHDDDDHDDEDDDDDVEEEEEEKKEDDLDDMNVNEVGCQVKIL